MDQIHLLQLNMLQQYKDTRQNWGKSHWNICLGKGTKPFLKSTTKLKRKPSARNLNMNRSIAAVTGWLKLPQNEVTTSPPKSSEQNPELQRNRRLHLTQVRVHDNFMKTTTSSKAPLSFNRKFFIISETFKSNIYLLDVLYPVKAVVIATQLQRQKKKKQCANS